MARGGGAGAGPWRMGRPSLRGRGGGDHCMARGHSVVAQGLSGLNEHS